MKCKNCEGGNDTCIECREGLNRKQEGDCECEDGYHDNNGQSKDCEICPLGCKRW